MASRLEKFRTYMARLNPAASPMQAFVEGLVVPRPGRSTAEQIAARLELDPTSSHLVIGGIGSGKTTQLLITCGRLNQLADTHAEYIDVSEMHDMSRMDPGTLIVVAGLAAGRLLEPTDDRAAHAAGEQFRRWAHGHAEWVQVDDEPSSGDGWSHDADDGSYKLIEEKPLLSPPERPIHWSVDDKAQALSLIRSALRRRFAHIVLLLDSLDRLPDPSLFATAVEQDVRALRKAGIGLVLVGPLRSMFGPHRAVADHFQHFYAQPAVDVQRDGAGLAFLTSVLRKRAPADLLPDPACRRLAELSGGVLRDLISLARAAGEEAYMRGAEQVEDEHIEAAADAFGRQLIFGLSPAEIEILQRVRQSGTFVQTSDEDLALLVTRRVLEYQNGSARFAVHPTLKPLLEQRKLVDLDV